MPIQLRLQLLLVNKDPEGSPPMQFQAAHMASFATKDNSLFGDFIKVRTCACERKREGVCLRDGGI